MALTSYELRIARELANSLFAPSDTIPIDAEEAGVVERFSMYLDALPTEQQLQLRAMLVAFDVAYAALLRAPTKRFSDVGPAEQREYLRLCDAQRGPQRAAWDGLRIVFVVAYTESPPVLRALGAEPMSLGQAPAREHAATEASER